MTRDKLTITSLIDGLFKFRKNYSENTKMVPKGAPTITGQKREK